MIQKKQSIIENTAGMNTDTHMKNEYQHDTHEKGRVKSPSKKMEVTSFFTTLSLSVHLFLLKIISRFGIWLGKCIIRMKRSRSVDMRNLKTFYLNRSDRIGDAIISKPFIKLLVRWLRNNNCPADIVIISSRYNHFILQELEDMGNNVYVREESKQIDDYESKLSRMILKHILFLYRTLVFRWTHGSKRDEQSLFFDMGGGDIVTILKYKEQYNSVIAGPNIFWGSHILDIALEHSYVHYSNINLIESYIEILTKSLALDNSFQDFVYENIGTFYEYDPGKKRTGICLFVGVKEFRNLPIHTWRRIIHEVSAAFGAETITVLDDNTNLLYETFIEELFPDNVIIEKNTYSLYDFTKHVASFSFVVGVDGGGINMVKSLTNSCFLNTFAQSNVWSGFTGKCPREVTKGAHNWYSTISEIPPHGQVIAHMHKISFWLPTFNIDGNRELFSDFDTSLLIGIIRKALR